MEQSKNLFLYTEEIRKNNMHLKKSQVAKKIFLRIDVAVKLLFSLILEI